MFRGTLIRSGNNAKTVKGDGVYETAIMYLAPANLAMPNRTVCPMAETAGCTKGCLFTAGRGRMSNVQRARIAKTLRYFRSRDDFMAELVDNIERFEWYCERKGVKPAVRLNGTSDIQWEVGHPVVRVGEVTGYPVEYASIFEAFPDVRFYDYTKIAKRAYRKLPANYTLVLSYSEANPEYAQAITKAAAETGLNYAVVFRTKESRELAMQHNFRGRRVFDGDQTDLRFTDPNGVVVGLYAKGAAKQDQSGFVVN